jgi:hypothetical protein
MPRDTDDTLDWMLARGDISEAEYIDFYEENAELIVEEQEGGVTVVSGESGLTELLRSMKDPLQAILDWFLG